MSDGHFIHTATRDLFGYLGSFESHWRDGWRPALDGDDILFRNEFGSYVRARESEIGDRFAYLFLWNHLNGLIRLAAPTTKE